MVGCDDASFCFDLAPGALHGGLLDPRDDEDGDDSNVDDDEEYAALDKLRRQE